MVVQIQRMTVEQFWEQYAGQPFELVRGELREMPSSGFDASRIASRILIALGQYVLGNDLGDVTTADGGYKLFEDTLRVPDVAYINKEKLAQITESEKFVPFPPDLAVEVISPHDRVIDLNDKIALYFEAGVQVVWVVNPARQTVSVHLPDGSSQTYTPEMTVPGTSLLPGFELPVASIFPAPSKPDNPTD